MIDARALAVLEEGRQARDIAELADEFEDVGGGTMSYAGPFAWANQACGLGLAGPVSDSDLDRIVEFYDARGEPGEVELAAYADPSVARGLASRGFALDSIENVFAIDVEEHRRTLRRAIPREVSQLRGLVLERIEKLGEAEIAEFIAVSTSGFRNEKNAAVLEKLTRRVIEHACSSSWIVRLDGDVCAATQMACRGDVACMFATSVLPEFRGRGIQRALIDARIEHGRESGARFVCIHSAPGIATERNARRAGMELVYAKAVLERRPR